MGKVNLFSILGHKPRKACHLLKKNYIKIEQERMSGHD